MANERELIFSTVAAVCGRSRPSVVLRQPGAAISPDVGQRPVAVMVAFWIAAIVGCTSPSAAAIVEFIFTPAAVAISFWLWRVSPGLYLSFIWQLFFFVCLIRRLADLQLGWNPTNPITVAPYLSALWCSFTLVRPSRQWLPRFALIGIGLLWALAMGILRNGISAAGFAMLEWASGPLIAVYLLSIENQIVAARLALFRTAVVGVIVMAFYGIAQYLALPMWDRSWILSADMASVIGIEPGRVRVFSTMNSPWPFAMVLMALLVFVMGREGRFSLRTAAVIVGLVTLIASQTRAAWGGLIAGWIVLVVLSGHARRRLLAMAALLAVIGGLALIAMPSAHGLTARIGTLGMLGSDDSLYVRTRFYQSFLLDAVSDPLGAGLGKTGVATRLSSDESMLHFDSGVMNVPYVLGWVGAVAYGAGLSTLLITVLRRRPQLSPAGIAAGAACVAMLSQMIFLNSLVAASGVVFWTLLGFCLQDATAISQPRQSRA